MITQAADNYMSVWIIYFQYKNVIDPYFIKNKNIFLLWFSIGKKNFTFLLNNILSRKSWNKFSFMQVNFIILYYTTQLLVAVYLKQAWTPKVATASKSQTEF